MAIRISGESENLKDFYLKLTAVVNPERLGDMLKGKIKIIRKFPSLSFSSQIAGNVQRTIVNPGAYYHIVLSPNKSPFF